MMYGINYYAVWFSPPGLNQEKAFPYSLEAPGPKQNIFRLLRAMQLRRPLLLEGAPGVGKTSLVMALARFSGHNIVRINLSEQTVRSPQSCGKMVHFIWIVPFRYRHTPSDQCTLVTAQIVHNQPSCIYMW